MILRDESASPQTAEMARRKAYTARMFRTTTLEFQKRTANDPALAPQRDVADILALGGGVRDSDRQRNDRRRGQLGIESGNGRCVRESRRRESRRSLEVRKDYAMRYSRRDFGLLLPALAAATASAQTTQRPGRHLGRETAAAGNQGATSSTNCRSRPTAKTASAGCSQAKRTPASNWSRIKAKSRQAKSTILRINICVKK